MQGAGIEDEGVVEETGAETEGTEEVEETEAGVDVVASRGGRGIVEEDEERAGIQVVEGTAVLKERLFVREEGSSASTSSLVLLSEPFWVVFVLFVLFVFSLPPTPPASDVSISVVG